jgi:hypothetical protein
MRSPGGAGALSPFVFALIGKAARPGRRTAKRVLTLFFIDPVIHL